MIIDSKGRLFGKISIVDILIIVVVLAGIGGLAYKFSTSGILRLNSGTDTIYISFYNEELMDYAAKSVKEGTIVIDPQKNTEFGKVKEIKIDKAKSITVNDAGQYVETSKPGYSSILITVEGKGTYSESGVMFGTEKYYIGKTLEVRFGNTAIFSKIYDIKKVEE